MPLLQKAIHPSMRDGNQQKLSGKEQLDFEMNLKAEDNTESTYKNVGVQDFGAALLRGMGWTGETTDNSNNNENSIKKGVDPNFGKLPTVRGERVGLGAISSGESRGGYKGKKKPGEKENAREKNDREGREFWECRVAEEKKRRREEQDYSDSNSNSSDSSIDKKHKKKKLKKEKKHKKKHKRTKH